MMSLSWLHKQLSSHDFFSSIQGATLHALAREFRQVRVRHGETLFERGEAGVSCFLVLSGQLRLVDPQLGAKDATRGDFAGVDQLFEDTPIRECTCTCVEQAICWTIDQKKLALVLAEYAECLRLEYDSECDGLTEATEFDSDGSENPANESSEKEVNVEDKDGAMALVSVKV